MAGKKVTDPALLARLRAVGADFPDTPEVGDPLGPVNPNEGRPAYVGPQMAKDDALAQKMIEGATYGFNDVLGGVAGAARAAVAPTAYEKWSPLWDRVKWGYQRGHDEEAKLNVNAGHTLGPMSLPAELAGGMLTGGSVFKGVKSLLGAGAKYLPGPIAKVVGSGPMAAGVLGGVATYGATENPYIASLFAPVAAATHGALGSDAAKNFAGKMSNEASEKWAKVIGSTGGQKADIDRVGGIDSFRELGRWARNKGHVSPFSSPEGVQARLAGQADANSDEFQRLLPDLQAKVEAAGQTRNPGVQFNINNSTNATAHDMGVTKQRFGNNLVANVNKTADDVTAMAQGERDLWLSGQGSPFAPVPSQAAPKPATAPWPGVPASPPAPPPAGPVQPALAGQSGPRQTTVAWQGNPNAVVTPPPRSPLPLPPGPPGPGEAPLANFSPVAQGPQVIRPTPIPGSGAPPTGMAPFGGVEPVPGFRPQMPGSGVAGGLPVGSTPQPALPAPAQSPLMDLPGAHNYSKGVGQSIAWGKKDAKQIAENTMLQDHWANIREELSGAIKGASRQFDPEAAPAWGNLLDDAKWTARGQRLADDGVARRAGFRFLGMGPTMAAATGNPWVAAALKAVQSYGNGVGAWTLDRGASSLMRGPNPAKGLAAMYQMGDFADSLMDPTDRLKLGQ